MTRAIGVRRAVTADGETCGHVIYEAFKALGDRHGFPPDFPSPEAAAGMVVALLAGPTIEGFVAEREGRPIGCAFIDLARPVAGVALIAVSPSSQAEGVGRRLMTVALESAETAGVASVRLIQAAYNNASLSLYTRLGFQTRTPLSVVQGEPPRVAIHGYHVRPAEEPDIAVCTRLCRSVVGYERTAELQAAIAARTAMVVQAAGRIVGYTTGVGFMGTRWRRATRVSRL